MKTDYYFALRAEENRLIINDGAMKRDEEWFRKTYGDDGWCNILPARSETDNISQAHREHRLSFNAEDVAAAESFWGVTLSVMAISAGLLALSRATGKQHVMVNWIFNNRLSPQTENAVGMLIKNLPAVARMEELTSLRDLLQSVRDQVAEGIAHDTYDFMKERYQSYLNDCMEVNRELGVSDSELDFLHPMLIELSDEFSAASARLELELLENEYGDGRFDSEMRYAEGMFEK